MQTALSGHRVLQAASGVVAAQGAEALRLEGVGEGAAHTVVTGEGVRAVAVVGDGCWAEGAVMVARCYPHLLTVAAKGRPLVSRCRALRPYLYLVGKANGGLIVVVVAAHGHSLLVGAALGMDGTAKDQYLAARGILARADA